MLDQGKSIDASGVQIYAVFIIVNIDCCNDLNAAHVTMIDIIAIDLSLNWNINNTEIFIDIHIYIPDICVVGF